jgi:SAM-dependent methyltransferase
MSGEVQDREVWDRHWQGLQGGRSSTFGALASLVRKAILSRAVRHYAGRFFPARGLLVETGCGTAQSSATIGPLDRTLAGLDFSLPALLEARRGATPFRLFLRGDIRALPFADSTVDGVWNLGVMEHFAPEEARSILRELLRVLRPGACAVLFWPPEFGLSRLVLAPIEWLRSRPRRPFRFFPDEVNRLRSKRHGRETLAAAGFEPVTVDFTPWDAFIHLVAVGRRPAERTREGR